MKYRSKISRAGSKRLFTATAEKIHKKNLVPLSRGGIRL